MKATVIFLILSIVDLGCSRAEIPKDVPQSLRPLFASNIEEIAVVDMDPADAIILVLKEGMQDDLEQVSDLIQIESLRKKEKIVERKLRYNKINLRMQDVTTFDAIFAIIVLADWHFIWVDERMVIRDWHKPNITGSGENP